MAKNIYPKKSDILVARRRDIKFTLIREDWKQIEFKIVVKKGVNIPAFGTLLLPDFKQRLGELFNEFQELGVHVYIGYKLMEDET